MDAQVDALRKGFATLSDVTIDEIGARSNGFGGVSVQS
jgi:hypothetical protein